MTTEAVKAILADPQAREALETLKRLGATEDDIRKGFAMDLRLHLFKAEDDFYAARTLEHAKELWRADTGQDPDSWGTEWQSIPDDAVIPERDEDTGEVVRKTAAQHAAEAAQPGCIGGFNY